MQIIWKGQSCFQITTQKTKTQVAITIDPFSSEIGLRPPSGAADIVLVTHDHHDHNNVKAVAGTPFVISGPGEYEIKDVYIVGIPSFHDAVLGKERGANTIYVIDAEDLRVCHLGDLGQKELTDDQLEKIGEVDILMIPVGGVYTIDGKDALKIMSQIEPKIIIPMHYSLPKLNPPAGGKLDDLDKFLKAAGIRKIEPLPKLTIKKKDLPEEEVKIVILKP